MTFPNAFPFQSNILKMLRVILMVVLALIIIVWFPIDVISTKAFFLAFDGTTSHAVIADVQACDPSYDNAHATSPYMVIEFNGAPQPVETDCIPNAAKGQNITVRYRYNGQGGLEIMPQQLIDSTLHGLRGVGTLGAVIILSLLLLITNSRLRALERLSKKMYQEKDKLR
jgi:hypothetical protein